MIVYHPFLPYDFTVKNSPEPKLIRCQELIALYACEAQLSSLLIGRHQISAETTERRLAQKQRPGEAKEKGEEIGRISGLHTTSPKPTPDVFSSQVG